MIILSEVAQKLEKILNSVDSEVNVGTFKNPLDYHFVVEAQGFHIDHIMEKNIGTNFIPVFLSSMGGQMNPVKGLKQGSYVIPITFYYPVRFRDDFFKLGDYLIECFVGQILSYGENSGKAVSNLSIPTYGEIQNFDLQEFKQWVENIYQRQIGVKTEPFMSMSVNLYLSTVADGFLFGNVATFKLKKSGEGEEAHEIIVDSASIQSNSQPSSEQEIDAITPESDGLPFGTSYGAGFVAYPKFENDNWWYNLLEEWFDGGSQDIELTLTISLKINNSRTLTFSRLVFIQSANMPIVPGQLLSITFSFGKKVGD